MSEYWEIISNKNNIKLFTPFWTSFSIHHLYYFDIIANSLWHDLPPWECEWCCTYSKTSWKPPKRGDWWGVSISTSLYLSPLTVLLFTLFLPSNLTDSWAEKGSKWVVTRFTIIRFIAIKCKVLHEWQLDVPKNNYMVCNFLYGFPSKNW